MSFCTVPVGFCTLQLLPKGWRFTVTLYGVPTATAPKLKLENSWFATPRKRHSATTAFTVRKVRGSASSSEGWNRERYSASASAVPWPEKWWAKTYGRPRSAASCAE